MDRRHINSSARAGRRATAAAVALLMALPASTRADHDRDEDRDDTNTPIRHVVVIFQENVSFDHYFATYPQPSNTDGTSFTGTPATPLVNRLFAGGLPDHNPTSTQPFRLSHAPPATFDRVTISRRQRPTTRAR